MQKIKWGILGTGKIANRFAQGLAVIPDAVSYAVGSRNRERAEIFAKEYGFKHIHGSYKALFENPKVDIIYIASPHPWHMEHASKALEMGKPVLCEKPMTVNATDGQTLVDLAKDKNLFLMEALWTRFLPSILGLQAYIEAGYIGEIKRIKADFSFVAPDDPTHRTYNPDYAGGALLDIGIYPINLAYILLKDDPKVANTLVEKARTGVDETSTYQLQYANGSIAELSASFATDFQKDAYILGTKGMIHIPLFWKAHEFFVHRKDQEIEHFSYAYEASGLQFQAMEAMRCLREGRVQSPTMPWKESLRILKLMDQLRETWGLKYPFEK